ncbi:hypothetical protein MHPYR_320076 [uncultured Mycobacterium sp.]|uniref:Radical SAM core domain-containing protein n=1 Tax=uncultured Mycobacterium sp. TaxID=171292 RepID=A0A1Y5PG12_9MYCO|nr:hypothetical protein MHPYR_300004 [uncultured Mycobacterium sp.]SBS76498.1 hypothetical protein MHPYR_320076 [uncultured Mycobacterium sp.]
MRRLIAVKSSHTPHLRRDAALIADDNDWELAHTHRYLLGIARDARPAGAVLDYVRLPAGFTVLGEGDVLGVAPQSRRVRVLYRRASRHNFFLVTERCNNYCLMCSQPPKKVDDGWLIDEIAQTIPLVDPATPALTFAGGEPLTDWRRFIGLVELTRDLLPNTAIRVLTNGRAFASPEVATTWADIRHPKLSAGIPIYAAHHLSFLPGELDSLVGFAQLRGYIVSGARWRAGPVAPFLAVGDLEPAVQAGFRDAEVLRDLAQRRLTLAGHSDDVGSELGRKRFRHEIDPSSEDESSQVNESTKPGAVPSTPPAKSTARH